MALHTCSLNSHGVITPILEMRALGLNEVNLSLKAFEGRVRNLDHDCLSPDPELLALSSYGCLLWVPVLWD